MTFREGKTVFFPAAALRADCKSFIVSFKYLRHTPGLGTP
jgi:hypothetical protein